MTSTGTELAAWVDQQMTQSQLDDEVGLLVLAALEGDAELDDHLAHGTSRTRPAPGTPHLVDPSGGTFLRTIGVEGFRGIGARVTLELQPRPGLTIVAGRNGSGKSSLSEALEFVLTGDTYRWNKSSVAWRQSWRNLHHHHAALQIDVVEESSGPVSITAAWPDAETDVDRATIKTQRPGAKQLDGLGHLGWRRALEQYRPILSYDELGGLLEGKPSELYDSLAGILGVEQLSDALSGSRPGSRRTRPRSRPRPPGARRYSSRRARSTTSARHGSRPCSRSPPPGLMTSGHWSRVPPPSSRARFTP